MLTRTDDPLDYLTGWALTAGGSGHEVQCVGILEALGISPEIKRVAPGRIFRSLAPWGPAAPDGSIAPPWPDVLVVSGRQSIPYARMIRRRSGGRTVVVALQSPGAPANWFDLVWVPEHDRLRGDNVIATLTSPHRLTRQRLAAEAAAHADGVAHLPRPLVTVLVGGASGAYTFHSKEARRLADDLATYARRHGCGMLVTPSRRTGHGKVAILKERLAGTPAVVWDLAGENPYFAYMGLADAFIVTCDSVNMLGEAAFTGKPIYAYRLPGGTSKFAQFQEDLVEYGAVRWFDGGFDRWTYAPLDATTRVADAVRQLLASRLRHPQIAE
ncbi:mitochondrial fission ELM1 family protein [Microbaculum marinum]|uniref:Mitochondrial fission ELM1 family protein n=1 Tax=Microbaculum marinum TaxID=1764581 RepID=A0AAW9REH0_9HYPH